MPTEPSGLVGRLLDVIGPRRVPDSADEAHDAPSLGWIAAVSVAIAAALLLLAFAHHQGYRDRPNAALQWGSYALLFLVVVPRVCRAATARSERIALVVLLGLAALAAKWLHSATRFVHFDELLHVATALDILERKALHAPNPLLPISPDYPALELIATCIVELTGLPLFAAGYAVLAVSRALLMAGLYCLYERVTGSSRVAAIACLVYMGNSGFMLFDGQFAYETPALAFFVFALLAAALCRDAASRPAAVFGLAIPLLAALAITHHMSSYFAAGFLGLLAMLALLNRTHATDRGALVVIAAAGILLPIAWSKLHGNPGGSYLGPIIESGGTELANLVSGLGRPRKLFSTAGGEQTALGLQLLSILALVVVLGGLCTGFFHALALSARPEGGWAALFDCLRLRWTNPWWLLLALAAVGFPVSVGFRLTSAGWEIGNRMGPFVFLGVGLVVAGAVTSLWQPAQAGRWRAGGTAVALTLCFIGGIITGWGSPSSRTSYRVSADASSIEPMGIEAAQWARSWLGPRNRFAADRVNSGLLAAYGRQTLVTSLFDGVDLSFVFLVPRLTAVELAALREGDVEYLMVDMRMTTAAPRYGYYFESGEYQETPGTPIDARNLLKFNTFPGIDRLFDNGSHIVFGTAGLRRAD